LGFGLLAVAQFVTSQRGDDRQDSFVEVAEEPHHAGVVEDATDDASPTIKKEKGKEESKSS
jgi:hypothetical protein